MSALLISLHLYILTPPSTVYLFNSSCLTDVGCHLHTALRDRNGTLTSHLTSSCDGQQFFPVRTVLLVKPCSVFCLSVQAPASVRHCHISWPCHVEKKVLLPRRKVKRSRRNAMLTLMVTAELSDVMKGRRWILMPLRSKECKFMRQKVSTIKAEITLGGDDGSIVCGNLIYLHW